MAYQKIFKLFDIKLDLKIKKADVYVIDKAEFLSKFPHLENGGVNHGGLVWQPRTELCLFIDVLTHEVAHSFSFSEFLILPREKEKPIMRNRRSGIAITTPHTIEAEPNKAIFGGAYEAMTEILAHEARKIIVNYCRQTKCHRLSESDQDILLCSYSYYPQVKLMRDLLKVRLDTDLYKNSLYRKIFTDYFMGTYSFLKDLHLNPNQIRILQNMSSDDEEVSSIRESLGL